MLKIFFEPDGRNISKGGMFLLLLPFFSLLLLFFFYPLVNLLSLSVTEPTLSLHNYQRVFSNPVYLTVLGRTVLTAVLVSVIALLMAYPVAWLMAHSSGPKLILITACILLPFWSPVLVRTAAWAVLLQRNGLVNQGLMQTGLIDQPLKLLYTQTAVLIAMTHVLLPFVVLPIYGAIRNVPKDYGRAAAILGAGPMRTFFEVIFPLTLPGVIGGMILTFLTALGYFITPSLLGSPKEMMIATLISQQLRETLDWPFAAALVGVLTVLVTVVTLLFSRVFKFNRMMGGGV
ncbi:ABC transporter permease [Brucella pinnipedialis]|uniref:ABC transporter permease n=1 Tax=Brucella pinnipedialis TaxID=120576 RepID=UPI0018A2E685|nr:ABC transporter permease [Brucella pinnipedialis]QPF78629.1 ABC transporter permease [Brucella pinnipedialis]